MIVEETVYNIIKNRLKQSGDLNYVKKVIDEGMGVYDKELPYITMDLIASNEIWTELPKRRENTLQIMIKGCLDVRNRADRQIVGDDVQVGILKFEHDIKKAFEGSDFRMTNNISNYFFETVGYPQINNDIRALMLKLTVKFNYFTAESRA